eukprot:scaffold38638_cov66-Phaeocystis_antarctica.AAC.2
MGTPRIASTARKGAVTACTRHAHMPYVAEAAALCIRAAALSLCWPYEPRPGSGLGLGLGLGLGPRRVARDVPGSTRRMSWRGICGPLGCACPG